MSATRTNPEWLQDLSAGGPAQEAALVDLRELLLRATLYFFSRNPGDFANLDRAEVLQRAEDSVQDALVALLEHLVEFRGDSKFTTWAYKFAINMALMTARRERWKGVSLDDLASDDQHRTLDRMLQDRSEGAAPEQSAIQGELRSTIREVIEHELTDKQRQVLYLMIFNEVPMDEVVRHLGLNRNAVYKLLHDARRKLKARLQARGLQISETLGMFGSPG